jgi:hypothetical protein
MKSAVKIDIMIPENHRVEIDLPADLPVGPAEIIVLAGPERPARRRGLRPIGLDVGKGRIADDFDAPLPEDLLELFEGRS